MRRLIARLIAIYQQTISPDHGAWRHNHPYGFCRFYPSCSEYTRQAVLRFGPGRGLWLGLRRLLRCYPWSRGGVDLVPQSLQR